MKSSGVWLSEKDDYNLIFAALKHPIRRQILLFLEDKGEASFTTIQNTVGLNDTGLMSYHLKELEPLVEQTTRGKYRLSEIGETSIILFRKVEAEKERSSKMVGKELETVIGKIFFLFVITGITMMAPLSVDMTVSVQGSNLSITYLIGLFLISLFGMLFGVMLFVFYDRHYFSKNTKTNINITKKGLDR